MAYEISDNIIQLFLKQFVMRYNKIIKQIKQDDKLTILSMKIQQLYLKYPILKYPF